ncbi:MAG TPA: SDR family oxidoreductase [Anaerolineae bacterium]|nr:SDR family oxidoreductase [Anaerolineae bacterium]
MQLNTVPFVQSFDKVTLITGGSKGIGEGCARVFVAAGASVMICARGREAGEALAQELSAKGPGTCHFEPCDVSKPEEIQQVIDKTVALYGRLDCLINNAGWHPPHKTIDEFSIEDFRDLLNLNLVSCFAAAKYALPYIRQVRGSIINMGSIVGEYGQWQATIYCATKGGIQGFTKALAIDEAKHGVRVNAVLPGNIVTQSRIDLEARLENGQAFHDFVEGWQWLGRSGTIEETGQVCLFLASDAASFLTGIELVVTGGQELGQGPRVPILDNSLFKPVE